MARDRTYNKVTRYYCIGGQNSWKREVQSIVEEDRRKNTHSAQAHILLTTGFAVPITDAFNNIVSFYYRVLDSFHLSMPFLKAITLKRTRNNIYCHFAGRVVRGGSLQIRRPTSNNIFIAYRFYLHYIVKCNNNDNKTPLLDSIQRYKWGEVV